MKKGHTFKFSVPRTKEHNEKIGISVSKAWTPERRKRQSELMKSMRKINKELLEQIKNQ